MLINNLKLKTNSLNHIKMFIKFFLKSNIWYNFLLKNFNSVFFLFLYSKKENNYSFTISKINFYIFCYNLSNNFIIDFFVFFLKKKKKILLLSHTNLYSFLFKSIIKNNIYFFFFKNRKDFFFFNLLAKNNSFFF